MKKINKKYILYSLSLIIFITTLALSSFKIINWYMEGKNINNTTNNLKKNVKEIKKEDKEINIQDKHDTIYEKYMNMNMLDVNFKEIKKINNDTIMWIKVNGTKINYPVVQRDNSFYLNHDFNKNKNSAGWLFLDYRNNIYSKEVNKIIYGHGRLDKIMFGTLKDTLTETWFNNKENRIIKTSSEIDSSIWEVFSVYTINETNDYIKTSFNNDSEITSFISKIKNRSVHNFNVNVNISDEILTLSTCYTKQKRLVMHAKKIKNINN